MTARSRLKKIDTPQPIRDVVKETPKPPSRPRFSVVKTYLTHLPTLVLALPFYGGVYYVLTRVHPATIRHFLVPNTYLPLLVLAFLGNFLLFSFVLLHTRRGLLLSTALTLLWFLQLQSVIITWQLIAGVLICFVIIEALLIVLFRKKHRS